MQEGYSRDNYLFININTVLKNLNKSLSGKTREIFMQTVYKLSIVHLEYNKKISQHKSLYCKEGGNLLSDKYLYNKKCETHSNASYKRLYIKMHPVISDILRESDYNYTIFNRQSYESLKSKKMKLLYYYFSISTLPGSFSKKFFINDLIELWPKTTNQKRIWVKRMELLKMLKQFEQETQNLLDLDAGLFHEDTGDFGIEIKKRKLVLN